MDVVFAIVCVVFMFVQVVAFVVAYIEVSKHGAKSLLDGADVGLLLILSPAIILALILGYVPYRRK